ncbi:hypothetical protein TBK1r_28750 [Stieleria magnilauensis]|uniref:Transposase n=1 Tax=Stieleria magnilauensis TaxID=2527963 RepID=A0ABX5XPJ5_9BACT|nr:hypothetical protein TBK1r_28750 [Planctomycetes bacterium TBK1r]
MPDTSRKYCVELSVAERKELQAIVRLQSVGVSKQRRARILLLSDVNHPDGRRTDANIAELVGLSVRQVVRIRQRFVCERDSQGVEAACERKPRPAAPERRKLDGKAEAQLIVLACAEPPDGRDHWTLQLLCDELARLKVVESVCPETVRQCLKKTSCSPGGLNATASPSRIGRDSSLKWKQSSTSISSNTMTNTS